MEMNPSGEMRLGDRLGEYMSERVLLQGYLGNRQVNRFRVMSGKIAVLLIFIKDQLFQVVDGYSQIGLLADPGSISHLQQFDVNQFPD